MTASEAAGRIEHWEAGDGDSGQRIDNFLLRVCKGVPKSHVYRILRSGEVRVNSKRVDQTYRLSERDEVRIPPIRMADPGTPAAIPAMEFDILYEDDAFLAINKPAGIAVHGGSGVSFGVIESLRPAVAFQRVGSIAELDAAVAAAAGKTVMLDFYADWCVSCKEMERYTFTDPAVQSRLPAMIKLQADVTVGTPEHQALLRRFRLFGPPGIVFFDPAGREIQGLRVIGFQSAEKFTMVLDQELGVR